MLDVKILGDLEMDDVNTKLCVDEFYPKENLDITEIKQQENKILINTNEVDIQELHVSKMYMYIRNVSRNL